MVAPSGIEPPTQGFSVPCSTDWAKEPWRSVRDSDPWSSAWQADVVGHCTNRPNWLREKDLNLRPLGYEPNELPDCSIPRYIKLNGGGKGIRTPAPLARPTGFQDRSLQPDLGIPPDWCLRSDLNRHEGLFSQDFKSCASTYSATQA